MTRAPWMVLGVVIGFAGSARDRKSPAGSRPRHSAVVRRRAGGGRRVGLGGVVAGRRRPGPRWAGLRLADRRGDGDEIGLVRVVAECGDRGRGRSCRTATTPISRSPRGFTWAMGRTTDSRTKGRRTVTPATAGRGPRCRPAAARWRSTTIRSCPDRTDRGPGTGGASAASDLHWKSTIRSPAGFGFGTSCRRHRSRAASSYRDETTTT